VYLNGTRLPIKSFADYCNPCHVSVIFNLPFLAHCPFCSSLSLSGVQVYLNGSRLPIKSFADYCDLYLGPKENGVPRIHERINDRWEIVISATDGQFQQVRLVVASSCRSAAQQRHAPGMYYGCWMQCVSRLQTCSSSRLAQNCMPSGFCSRAPRMQAQFIQRYSQPLPQVQADQSSKAAERQPNSSKWRLT
jgi:hypothetical protein